MTAPLTFGDTFTLPATGDSAWHIRDMRPTSYLPPENLSMPHHREVARAECTMRILGWASWISLSARYELGHGWVLFRDRLASEFADAVAAELDALSVDVNHHTDDEWRAMHFAELRQELEQAIGTTMLGGTDRAVAPHPLVSAEETIAFAVATVAEIASQRPGAELFDPLYWATIERLRA